MALLGIAVATAIAWWQLDPARALAVTFAVLVVSCPCALSLATPAALAAAAGALGRRRVVIARADALESLARVTHVVFDKTGTLTAGRLTLTKTIPIGDTTPDTAIALAASLESVSEHPIARAIVAASGTTPPIPVGRRACSRDRASKAWSRDESSGSERSSSSPRFPALRGRRRPRLPIRRRRS